MDEELPRPPPRELAEGSRDFLSNIKTEAGLPVDFFFPSNIFHGPEVELGGIVGSDVGCERLQR
jgi:hypothetical protein